MRSNKVRGTCRLMIELNRHIEDIERAHNVKLTDKEIEKLKSMLCSNVCNGRCQAYYHRVLQ